MRVFAVSDLHVDYPVNARWVQELSTSDYRDDAVIVAGDVSDSLRLLSTCLAQFSRCFRHVFFVPGNHELWTARDGGGADSWNKFERVCAVARDCGAIMTATRIDRIWLVPLLSWYDHSFGVPGQRLRDSWMDYYACSWPEGWDEAEIVRRFTSCNRLVQPESGETVITYSHFVPRLDLLSAHLPQAVSWLFPVLGTTTLERQIRQQASAIHVYGHSHVNRDVSLEGTRYINNAYGYPAEGGISGKRLRCILDDAMNVRP